VDRKHELLAMVRDMALEKGATPSRDEFARHVRGGRSAVDVAFGSWTAFIQAAGLEPSKFGKKLDNSIFEKDLGEMLASHVQSESQQPTHYTPTLIIPDTHFPFASQRVLDAIYEWAQKYKPARVVQVGDLYDLYAHSKFPRSQNVYNPKQEEELGRKGAEAMWSEIRRILPQAECVQLIGNHDLRPLKQTLAMMPSLEHVIEKYLQELMTFPGVKLIGDPRQEYECEGVQYIHGYRSGFGAHLRQTLVNTVHGHDHKLGVAFHRVRGQTLWELHSGFAGDSESKVFHYTPQKSTQEMPGFGFLDERGPRAIPV
jgi:hypothetical protein